MDRYVIKERRTGADYQPGNQMIAFSASSTIGNNITILNSTLSWHYGDKKQKIKEIYESPLSPNLYYGACDLTGVQNASAGFVNVNMNTPRFVQNNMHQNQGQIISGIDPCYLAAYSSDNITSIAGPSAQSIPPDQSMLPGNVPFGTNYQNSNLYSVEKVVTNPFLQQQYHQTPQGTPVTENVELETRVYKNCGNNRSDTEPQSPHQLTPKVSATTRKQSEVNLLKNEAQYQVRTRSDKLKVLHKSGPRAFSGPVEKVLKWHKSLQDIGLLVFYEIVAKCVSVRPGERCAKNIVVRDDNGPAMQVVYYEVDFFLPELKPPCTIRVIGRMMPGTCRLQAFNVRIATGDDVSTLPRRAAVAAHHVAKLCKEYGRDSDKTMTF